MRRRHFGALRCGQQQAQMGGRRTSSGEAESRRPTVEASPANAALPSSTASEAGPPPGDDISLPIVGLRGVDGARWGAVVVAGDELCWRYRVDVYKAGPGRGGARGKGRGGARGKGRWSGAGMRLGAAGGAGRIGRRGVGDFGFSRKLPPPLASRPPPRSGAARTAPANARVGCTTTRTHNPEKSRASRLGPPTSRRHAFSQQSCDTTTQRNHATSLSRRLLSPAPAVPAAPPRNSRLTEATWSVAARRRRPPRRPRR